MRDFEDIVLVKLDHVIQRVDEMAAKIEDHEVRMRVLEKFKYTLMAAGTTAAATLGAAGHKIGTWLGISSQ